VTLCLRVQKHKSAEVQAVRIEVRAGVSVDEFEIAKIEPCAPTNPFVARKCPRKLPDFMPVLRYHAQVSNRPEFFRDRRPTLASFRYIGIDRTYSMRRITQGKYETHLTSSVQASKLFLSTSRRARCDSILRVGLLLLEFLNGSVRK